MRSKALLAIIKRNVPTKSKRKKGSRTGPVGTKRSRKYS